MTEQDAISTAAAIQSGEVTVAETAATVRERVEREDGAINAVTWMSDTLVPPPSGAIGPLAGVPWLLKASLEFPNWPFTSCSRARKDVIGQTMWPFARACIEAGLVPVGLTGMPEFGLLTTGEPLASGPVVNPHLPGRSAGGSSSGAAAAVAAGFAPLAHASDAAGSIRIPAANCGVIGLKPSRGGNLRARAPHLIDDVLCSDMLIARTMRDVKAAFDIVGIAQEPRSLSDFRGLKVGLVLHGLDERQADADVVAVIRRAADALDRAGAIVEPARMPGDLPAIGQAFRTIWLHEGRELIEAIAAANPGAALEDLLEPWTLGLAQKCASLPLEATAAMFRQFGESERACRSFFSEYDLLLSPVAQERPIELGRHAPDRPFDELWDDFWPFVNFTPLANIAGLPSITLPFWDGTEGPTGTMLTMAKGRDLDLLALSSSVDPA